METADLFYEIMDGMVSDEGRNKLLFKCYDQVLGPHEFKSLYDQIKKNPEGSLTIIDKGRGIYLRSWEAREILLGCLKIMGLGRASDEIKEKWIYLTKRVNKRTSLDEELVQLENSEEYDKAVELLLEKGETERARLYQAAKRFSEIANAPLDPTDYAD